MGVRLATISIFITFLANVTGQQCQNDAICVPIDKCPLLAKPLMANFINADKSSLLVSLFRRLRCDRSSICCPQIYVPGYIETQRPRPVTTTHKPIADDLLPSHKVCGKSTPDRIVGGNLTDIDEHPWLALLRYDIGHGNFGSYCGGVLISSKYVLTAAHCISGDSVPTSWKVTQVRLGEWNTSSPIDCNSNECAPPAIDVPVDYITVHEKYDPLDINQFYDIALIRLNNSVPFTDFVKPICLPEVDNKNYTGYDLEVSGWGATEIESASDVKLKVVLPVVSNEQCAKQYARAQREIRAEQICAGALNGKDSCRGDSGGPLMGKDLNGDWISIGVVSYGPTPCGTEGWPGVYTRTSSYVNWIKSNLQP